MKTIVVCLLAIGLVFADIDLSKEQTLYQVSPDGDECSKLGLTGKTGGEVKFSPTDDGVQITGTGSLGDQKISCKTITLAEAEKETSGEEEMGITEFTSLVSTLDNRVYFFNCTVGETVYASLVVSSKPGTFMTIDQCDIGLYTKKETNIADYVISGTIGTEASNCSSQIQFSGKFSVSNITGPISTAIPIGSATLESQTMVNTKDNTTYQDVTALCPFVPYGAAAMMMGCSGFDSKSASVEIPVALIYVPFEDETLVIVAGEDGSMCTFTLWTGLLRFGFVGALLFGLLNL